MFGKLRHRDRCVARIAIIKGNESWDISCWRSSYHVFEQCRERISSYPEKGLVRADAVVWSADPVQAYDELLRQFRLRAKNSFVTDLVDDISVKVLRVVVKPRILPIGRACDLIRPSGISISHLKQALI